MDLSESGKLIGLLHDLGKYNEEFQYRLLSNHGYIQVGDPNFRGLFPKVDHATVGAQFCGELLGISLSFKDTLQMAIISHHSGLYDMIDKSGETPFYRRLNKKMNTPELNTGSLSTIKTKIEPKILSKIEKIANSNLIDEEFKNIYRKIGKLKTVEAKCISCYLLLRLVYSSLIDADCLNAAGRGTTTPVEWGKYATILEDKISKFDTTSDISKIRSQISKECLDFASNPFGVVKLTVPTGGGKTLSSLRFALNYAHKHGKKRIFYILPYTSIIKQNADITRKILDLEKTKNGDFVLEHHSNLDPKQDNEFMEMVAENWDAPIIYTTMVQLLNVLFSEKKKYARRFHNLSDSVIIFDEIQSIPLKTIHLFNNAINFLSKICHSAVVLCSATQPILDRVDGKGAIELSNPCDMITNPLALFQNLKRTEVAYVKDCDIIDNLASFVKEKVVEHKSLLAIVNTKAIARDLFKKCCDKNITTIHLSTNMCPKHRIDTIDKIKRLLLKQNRIKPLLVISTQLIEAGVDISFCSAVRMMAGLDSIAQASGRCNRNMERNLGFVYIVDNTKNYFLPSEIKIASTISKRVIMEFDRNPKIYDDDILHPDLTERYYQYYFKNRSGEMDYPIMNENLLDLFSVNKEYYQAFMRSGKNRNDIGLTGAYRTAGECFEPIEDTSGGVIVLYGKSRSLINKMSLEKNPVRFFKLLREAQQFSVNISESVMKQLIKKSAISKIATDVEIYVLDKDYYDLELGVTKETR